MRVWCGSLRVDFDRAGVAELAKVSPPLTALVWHNRLFVMPWLARTVWPQRRRLYALVSASRDGAPLARFLQMLGLFAVRGSSSRYGREAMQELIAVQRGGGDLAVTPDGPRGPIYQLKAGAVLVARRTRSPLLLIGVEFASAWRLRSWDRFCIPKPFSRVVVRTELLDSQQLPEGEAGLEVVRQRLLTLSGIDPAQWPVRRPLSGRLPLPSAAPGQD